MKVRVWRNRAGYGTWHWLCRDVDNHADGRWRYGTTKSWRSTYNLALDHARKHHQEVEGWPV